MPLSHRELSVSPAALGTHGLFVHGFLLPPLFQFGVNSVPCAVAVWHWWVRTVQERTPRDPPLGSVPAPQAVRALEWNRRTRLKEDSFVLHTK